MTGLVCHVRVETTFQAGAGHEIAERRPEVGGQPDEGFLSEVREVNLARAGEWVFGGKGDDEWLRSDGFDDEVAMGYREQRKSDLDAPVRQGFNLFGRVEVVKIEGNIRMLREEHGKNPSQHPILRRGPEAHRETADLAAACLLCHGHGAFRLTENVAGLVQEKTAGVRQRDEVTRAVKQLHTEIAFQISNLVGEGRLGNMELFRGATEMQLLGDRDEIPEMAQVHIVG